jgi:circadian clock protein KaiC
MDTWLLVRYLESNGERNRGLYILKSRGMEHSNQIREFKLTNHGFELLDAYVGGEGVLTGSARVAFQAVAKIEAENRELELKRKQQELERKRKDLASQIDTMRSSMESITDELNQLVHGEKMRKQMVQSMQDEIATSRQAEDNGKGATQAGIEKERKNKSKRSAGTQK